MLEDFWNFSMADVHKYLAMKKEFKIFFLVS